MFRRIVMVAVALTALAQPVSAMDGYLTPYVGYFDIARSNKNQAAQFGLEYRAGIWDYGVRPTIGFNVTNDGAVYGYGGFNWDIKLASGFYVIPNFMVGAYNKGDGKELGGALEFRSGLEFDYQFKNDHRLGLAFNHISNASIYHHNPGAETLLLTYSIPVAAIFGK